MTVHRIMGLETEYGVLAPADLSASPMLLSGLVVTSYGARVGRSLGKARWDYEDENPLCDARGYTVQRERAHPSQLTDQGRSTPDSDDDVVTANVVLTNGARLYVDHAHPEYSTPEVTNPLAAVVHDKAGEQVMTAGAQFASDLPDHGEIRVYKNNTDNKGASYGTHENYLMDRKTPFPDIVKGLLPFFASRLVFTGNGRVGLGQNGEEAGFQISQRADFMEVEVGLETTLKRPLVNTRDEPHAIADRYRRLHVIVGDANRFEMATLLKLGTTSLVLTAIEHQCAPPVVLADPVAALRTFSRDPSLTATAVTDDGRHVSALDVQWMYYELAEKVVREQSVADPGGVTELVLAQWHAVLTDLGADPFRCTDRLDWVAKWQLLEAFRDRDGLAWDAPRLELIDVQFADMRPQKGLYDRLVTGGKTSHLVDDVQVRTAMTEPPHDTRAYFRGRCLSQFGDHVTAASWDSVIMEVPGKGSLHRIPMMDPWRGTKSHVEELLESAKTPQDLMRRLSAG